MNASETAKFRKMINARLADIGSHSVSRQVGLAI